MTSSDVITKNYEPTPEEIEALSRVRDEWTTTPSMDSTYMMYYDVESLNNLFTVSVYDPNDKRIILFYLFDDEQLEAQIDINTAKQKVLEGNTFINRMSDPKHKVDINYVSIKNLKDDASHKMLCYLLGLSMTDDVNETPRPANAIDALHEISPISRRLVHFSFLSDTHVKYNPSVHWTVVGYNSSEYDSSIMAKYFYASESQAREYAKVSVERERMLKVNAGLAAANQQPQPVIEWPANEPHYIPTTAKEMRRYNDLLFNFEGRMSMMENRDSEIGKIRLAMLNSGRHLDIALLNEKMKFVKLKRLCGMLGYQILESEKLSGPNATIDTIDEFYDLLTYNASDTINLYRLAHHPVYANAFDQKAALIHRYAESVFNNLEGKGFNNGYDSEKPLIASNNVNDWRLRPDSTSAQIVGKFLAPYASLQDIPCVSFDYPSERKVEELRAQGRNIERFNVLTRVKEMFFEAVENEKARAVITEALSMYEEIQGKNFNANPTHLDMLYSTFDRGTVDAMLKDGKPYTFDDITKPRLNVPYFDKDGKPTDCYVTFSTGGIHGAQLNQIMMSNARRDFDARIARLKSVMAEFPDPTEMRSLCGQQPVLNPDGTPRMLDRGVSEKTGKPLKSRPMLTKDIVFLDEHGNPMIDEKTGKEVTFGTKYIRLKDGTFIPHTEVLQPGSTIKNGCKYRDLDVAFPMTAFVDKFDDEGELTGNKPNGKLTYTSVGLMIHQDFTSYYPSLITNMSGFYNKSLGEDRYVMAYDEKNALGRLKKDAQANSDLASFAKYNLQQKNMKLILNSASGAADAQTGKKIRLNNMIISMRLIGQMFTWMLAQLEVLEGAQMPSTNTDGIYAKIDMEVCQRVLDKVRDIILVEIEPEELLLVSKDSNNRLELFIKKDANMDYLTMDDIKEIGASGGTLACHDGPNPLNSLAHPAVIDYVTAQYLAELALLQHNAEQATKRNAEIAARSGETPIVIPATLSITDEFNAAHAHRFLDGLLGRDVITPATALPWKPAREFDWFHALKMFQTMIVANPTSMSFPFTFTMNDDGTMNHSVISDINRVFFVKENANLPGRDIKHIAKANAAKITPAGLKKMKAEGARPCHGALTSDPVESQIAYNILAAKGYRSEYALPKAGEIIKDGTKMIADDREVKITKIPGINPDLNVIIVNDDIECMDEADAMRILDALDLDVYLDMARSTYEESWRNMV